MKRPTLTITTVLVLIGLITVPPVRTANRTMKASADFVAVNSISVLAVWCQSEVVSVGSVVDCVPSERVRRYPLQRRVLNRTKTPAITIDCPRIVVPVWFWIINTLPIPTSAIPCRPAANVDRERYFDSVTIPVIDPTNKRRPPTETGRRFKRTPTSESAKLIATKGGHGLVLTGDELVFDSLLIIEF